MNREMRQVLVELELISHGATVRFDPSTSGGEAGSRVPTGEHDPPHIRFRERFEKCRTERDRVLALEAARSELKSLTIRTEPVTGVDGAELLRRQVLEDYVGTAAVEVAIHLYCTTSKVRKIRGDQGLDPDTGLDTLASISLPAGRANQALFLYDLGQTHEQIAKRLGVSQPTVSRLLEVRRISRNAA